MSSARPTRERSDLADVLEMVLDKGIVINADVAISVGETELLGIEIRAAIASFETAANYGLAFPSGTDMRRVEQASGREPIPFEDEEGEPIDLGIGASRGGSRASESDASVVEPLAPATGSTTSGSDTADDADDADEG
jgi:hypothetical protein